MFTPAPTCLRIVGVIAMTIAWAVRPENIFGRSQPKGERKKRPSRADTFTFSRYGPVVQTHSSKQ